MKTGTVRAPHVPHMERTLAIAGDTMLGRGVNPVLLQRAPEYVWGDALPIMLAADARIINLECVISDRGEPWEPRTKVFHFRAHPRAIEALGAAHIDYASLANNHILDFGDAAMLDCLERLDRAGIAHAGAGTSFDSASALARLDVRGLAVGFVSCTDNMKDWAAGAKSPGLYHVDIGNARSEEELLQRLAAARKQVDLVVLSVHWGANMTVRPTPAMVQLAHGAIEAGADVVHGHSAHVFHGIEIYRDRPILYDTGDWVDDYAIDPSLRNDWTFLTLLGLEGSVPRELILFPCVIEDRQVRRARAEAPEMIARLERRCREFGTRCEIRSDRIAIPIS